MSNSVEQQNQLVMEHMHLAHKITNSMLSKLPSYISKEDLISVAFIGLVTAASRFDPDREVLFRTFAEHHIRGSIVDELRTTDTMKRTARLKSKLLEKETHKLEGLLGRTPNNHELAESIGISIDAYHKLASGIGAYTFTSIDDSKSSDGDTEVSLGDIISDSPHKTPSQDVAGEQVANLLYQAIRKLPIKEKLIVSLYYGEGTPLKDIGMLLNRSESRISQLLIGAIQKVREEVI